MEILGERVYDKVTEFKGTVTSYCTNLYGNDQALVVSSELRNGKVNEKWFAENRLALQDESAKAGSGEV